MIVAPIAVVLLAFGAVLTSVSPIAGSAVASLGAVWQVVVSLFASSVTKDDDDLRP